MDPLSFPLYVILQLFEEKILLAALHELSKMILLQFSLPPSIPPKPGPVTHNWTFGCNKNIAVGYISVLYFACVGNLLLSGRDGTLGCLLH